VTRPRYCGFFGEHDDRCFIGHGPADPAVRAPPGVAVSVAAGEHHRIDARGTTIYCRTSSEPKRQTHRDLDLRGTTARWSWRRRARRIRCSWHALARPWRPASAELPTSAAVKRSASASPISISSTAGGKAPQTPTWLPHWRGQTSCSRRKRWCSDCSSRRSASESNTATRARPPWPSQPERSCWRLARSDLRNF
jgi:hypothetical protein